MNWTDFFFGALAGTLFTILVAGAFVYRSMRPYMIKAALAAKTRTAMAEQATKNHTAWPPGGNA